MGIFERFMSLWVALAILAGAVLGWLFPGPFASIAQIEFAHVNLVIAVFIWLMIYPMMVQVDFSSLRQVTDQPKGLALTLVVNWLNRHAALRLATPDLSLSAYCGDTA